MAGEAGAEGQRKKFGWGPRQAWAEMSPVYATYNRTAGPYSGPMRVYKITNTVTGAFYIGSETRPKSRWKSHLHRLRNNKHHSRHMQNSFNKHGETAFVFTVLEEYIDSYEQLLAREQYYIDLLKPPYNVCPVVGSRRGHSPSAETRAKLSAAHKGRPLSDEHKAKIGAANTGKVRSQAQRDMWSKAHAGRKQTPEHRKSQSEAVKRCWQDPVYRENHLAAMRRRFAKEKHPC